MSSPHPIYEPDRLNAFSDGIFAFAATLLVLQFTVPDALTVKQHGLDYALAKTNFFSDLLTFVLSFVIVTIYRSAHQRVFSRIEHADGIVSSLNTFFLLFIAFLPFATALFSSYVVELSLIIYAGTLGAAGSLLTAINFYAGTKPALTPPERRRSRGAMIRDASAPAIFLLSIPLSLLVGAGNAPYSWILIAVTEPALNWIFERGKDRGGTPPTQTRRQQTPHAPTVATDDDEAHPS